MPNLGPNTHLKTHPPTNQPKDVATTDKNRTDGSSEQKPQDDKPSPPTTSRQDQPSSSTGHVPAAPTDDRPQREDEHLSKFLQDSNPEKDPGHKKG